MPPAIDFQVVKLRRLACIQSEKVLYPLADIATEIVNTKAIPIFLVGTNSCGFGFLTPCRTLAMPGRNSLPQG
jgi:hypothetical protein